MPTADNLKTVLRNLQSDLEGQRQSYYRYKKDMELWYPTHWRIIDEAFKTIAAYLTTERIRVKHEIAEYMQGLDVSGGYGEAEEITQLHQKFSLLKLNCERDAKDWAGKTGLEIMELEKKLKEKIYVSR